MSDYRVAASWNVALASLIKINPQPKSPGIQVTRRNYLAYAAGAIVDEGLYVELAWNVLGASGVYQSLLTQFGLVAAKSAPVTIYCRDDLFAYARYNGIAVRPQQKWDNYFPRDTVILIRDLILSS